MMIGTRDFSAMIRTMRLKAPLAIAGAHALPAAAPISAPVARALGIPRRVHASGIALTFDDGPHPEGTPAVLELLRSEDLVATFFVAGEQVERFPQLARDIVAAGHEIGLHCHRHRNQLRLTPPQVGGGKPRGRPRRTRAAGRPPSSTRPGALLAFSGRPTASTRRRAWRTRGGATPCCCGHAGGTTGARAPHPSRSPPRQPEDSNPAT